VIFLDEKTSAARSTVVNDCAGVAATAREFMSPTARFHGDGMLRL
jgi:hypothetical protein